MKAGWTEVALGEVAMINPRQATKIDPDEEVAFVGMADLSAETAIARDSELRRYRDVSTGYTPFGRGDILIAKITPCFENGKIGEAATSTNFARGSTEFHVVRPNDGRLDRRFLLHFLRRRDVTRLGTIRMTGSGGQRRVPDRFVSELKLPLPPIKEQRRIAVALDAADALRVKRRQAIAKLDTLTQAIFIDMFGDPVTNPMGWPDNGLGAVVADLHYGHRFYDDSYSDDGTPIVRITDLDASGNLNFSSMPRMRVTDEELKKHSLRPGELIFARSGATVGKTALVRVGDPQCIAGAYFICLTFDESIHPCYAFAVLTSTRVQSIIARKSRQAAQQNFSGPGLRRLPLPVPPLELQAEYAQRVEALRERRELLNRDCSSLDSLFASLQQRAFRGEL